MKATSPYLLVIDDEPDNFDVVEILLFKEGYHLEYVNSGPAALAFLENHIPDVILLDVMMPEMDGLEVCRRLKASPQWQHIPVIMVTALNSKQDLASCLEAGADDFVGKPVNGIELRARVRSMLRIKQQYDELQHLLALKEDSLQLREDMSNMVVHDLRNPLSTIVLACDILEMAGVQDKQAKKVEQIRGATRQLECLVDSLLLMAKLESGRLVLNPSNLDLESLCHQVASEFEEIATQKGVKVIINHPPHKQTVCLDPLLIQRVLDNLVSNAIKFSPYDSQVTIEVSYPEDFQMKIHVKDTGRGVSEELKERLFQKYEVGEGFQGVKQTGLGLAFCKMAIEAHGGQISLEANEPKGSIFTVAI
ncbi:MAG: hybrid sensor histidine kinase/response regulator [Alkalinema sp. CACIAM 70d]|nr:MAG: hybrid sensor histidine kinase/response regulator [Alkalinema sp. CACIAM 70d]